VLRERQKEGRKTEERTESQVDENIVCREVLFDVTRRAREGGGRGSLSSQVTSANGKKKKISKE
jgi:hypothetical protein